MNWYYHDGKNRNGPLNAKQFKATLSSGAIINTTLVWKTGMKNWKTWHALRMEPDIQILFHLEPERETITCRICRESFPLNEVIAFEDHHICKNCKPEFVQRIKEGAPLPEIQITPSNFASEIVRRDYNLSLRKCLANGFRLLRKNFWTTAGLSFIAISITILTAYLSRFIPYSGTITNMIVSGPLYGGLFYFFICLTRGKHVGFFSLFDGFRGQNIGQLILGYIIPFSFYFAGYYFARTMLFKVLVLNPLYHGTNKYMWIGMQALISNPIFSIIFLIFSYMLIFFTLGLIFDRRLNFWSALLINLRKIKKHWLKCLGVATVCSLIGFSGILLFFIGILVTMPVFYGAMAYAYIEIFKG